METSCVFRGRGNRDDLQHSLLQPRTEQSPLAPADELPNDFVRAPAHALDWQRLEYTQPYKQILAKKLIHHYPTFGEKELMLNDSFKFNVRLGGLSEHTFRADNDQVRAFLKKYRRLAELNKTRFVFTNHDERLRGAHQLLIVQQHGTQTSISMHTTTAEGNLKELWTCNIPKATWNSLLWEMQSMIDTEHLPTTMPQTKQLFGAAPQTRDEQPPVPTLSEQLQPRQ